MSATLPGVAIGTTVRAAVTFTMADGTPADPTTVVCHVLPPTGAAQTYTYGAGGQVVRESVGVYYVDLHMTQPYTWRVKFVGTGTVSAAVTGDISVSQDAWS